MGSLLGIISSALVLYTESPLCLGCSDAIPQTCDREYEKCLVVSVGQATITQRLKIIIIW